MSFDFKKYLAEGKLLKEEYDNVSIAKEIIDMISMEQNESGEFDYDDAETYIVDILKKHGIK